MEHLTLALYILFFTTGSAGAGALVVLAWRHRSPLLNMMLVVDLLYGVGLGASMAYFYVGNVAGFLPLDSASLLQGAATVANGSQTLLYLQVGLFALSLNWKEGWRRVLKATTVLAAFLVVAQGVWALVAPWFSLPRMFWPGGWVVTLALALLGCLLVTLARSQPSGPLRFLTWGWSCALLLFVPAVVLEDWISSLGLYARGTFQMDFFFSFVLNLLAVVALARWLGHKQVTQADAVGYRVCEEAATRWGLTPREKEIVPLVAQGLANKEIAYALGISPATVRTHLSNLFQKTGARSRIDLVNRLR